MDYGDLIGQAWRITWRHRFLWLLGFFAGGTGGSAGFNLNGVNPRSFTPRSSASGQLPGIPPEAVEQVTGFVRANLAAIVVAVALIVLVGLVLIVLSLIAQGGIVRACADIATGHGSSAGAAWRAGRDLFWRYVRLALLIFLVFVAVAIVVGLGIAALVVFAVIRGDEASGGLVAIGILVGLAFVGVAIVAGVVGSVVVTFAQRAIAIEDTRPMAALVLGWRLFRRHMGTSLLVWLVSLAVSVGMGIAAAVAGLLILALLGAIGFGLYAVSGGFTTLTIAYAVVAGVALVVAGCVALGLFGAFAWNYWTLAYMRLRARDAAGAVG